MSDDWSVRNPFTLVTAGRLYVSGVDTTVVTKKQSGAYTSTDDSVVNYTQWGISLSPSGGQPSLRLNFQNAAGESQGNVDLSAGSGTGTINTSNIVFPSGNVTYFTIPFILTFL